MRRHRQYNRRSQEKTISIHEPPRKMLHYLKNKQKVRGMEENEKRVAKELPGYHKRKQVTGTMLSAVLVTAAWCSPGTLPITSIIPPTLASLSLLLMPMPSPEPSLEVAALDKERDMEEGGLESNEELHSGIAQMHFSVGCCFRSSKVLGTAVIEDFWTGRHSNNDISSM